MKNRIYVTGFLATHFEKGFGFITKNSPTKNGGVANNDIANFASGNLGYVSTLGLESGYVHKLDVTANPDGENIFFILNLLPTSGMDVWAGFSIGEINFTYSEFLELCELDPSLGEGVIDIESGKEYYFDVDCGDCAISLGNLTKAATGTQMVLSNDIVKGNTQNTVYNPNLITPEQSVNVMELIKTLK